MPFSPIQSQNIVELNLNETGHSVVNKPIDTTGATYSLTTPANNSEGTSYPIGNTSKDL